MSVTTEQFNEMKARTEKARKKPASETVLEKAGWRRLGCDEWTSPETGQHFPTSVAIKLATHEAGFAETALKGFCVHSAPGEGRCPITDRGCKGQAGSVRIVLDFWAGEGVPRPLVEDRFHHIRKWRLDFAWDYPYCVYLEVQGSIHGTGPKCKACGQRRAGRHTRGPALLLEHEKLNTATEFGWRPLFCTPQELLTVKLTQTIKRALKL